MKQSYFYLILFFLYSILLKGQENVQLTSKDSIVQSSWMFGIGYNFVDDSGDAFNNLTAFKTQWNALAYPNRLSLGRYFKSGLGVEAIATYNRYKVGKIIDQVINTTDTPYWAIDGRISYDLNKIIGQTGWFDPYVGAGFGYTDAKNEPRTTYNAIIGFRAWLSERIGLDFSSSGKWRTGDKATNHIQHAAGIVYQFGIEKGLSKKGEEKLALINALEKEQQRVKDSLSADKAEKEAKALAERLAKEKELTMLANIEKEAQQEKIKRKQSIEQAIRDLGFVYFDLNSSYLNSKSKRILDNLAKLLKETPELQLKVSSHTDSRGKSNYNKWLSQRRVNRTVAYLIDQGISESRLTKEAYGEEHLLNDCDDNTYCPEEKHQINRRSEFSVVNF